MREVEKTLAEAPLQAPSARLQDRLEEAFARAERRPFRWFQVPVPLWLCGVVAVACGAFAYWVRAATAPPPPRVVYILPVEGELRRMLTGEEVQPQPSEAGEWRVTVTTLPGDEL